ncbi:transcriptional regulator, IclR family [Tistlia consotensis]|uniref:Transcriptional regulator, IclR family n=1 Tax=Tistlia consotensis USBA 355 TaxID=560819 RepID=A0A1Y6B3X2_9PROT|nr:IclR family transcriptional regulator [Tistlia consotensis]SME90380.1 transcriptional regulator, IclR family [Tistlia consotensis USBA 355]SNR26706.1 transcriptional regulator, IclR family [Tistlia consotensis]
MRIETGSAPEGTRRRAGAPAPAEPRAGGAVDRILAMIELLAGADEPLRLSEIAQRLAIPKSAAHRLLSTLVEKGWAEQNAASDCYGLTLYMALLGQSQLARLKIHDLRQPILDDLAKQTRELVRLTALQRDQLVWIGSSRGRRSGLVYEPDMNERIVPFATANGKVWLATLPRETALRIALDAGLGSGRGLGPGVVTTLEQLGEELDLTAARGYGTAREEAEEGVGAVAVPVLAGGRFVGSMSVAAPMARLTEARIEEILPRLRRAAQNMALAWQAGG